MEHPYMPVSANLTTQGRKGTRIIAPLRVAFRHVDDVSALK